MRKILLTTCAAALFSLAAYAQEEQDTTQSNQYRPIPQEQDLQEDTTDVEQSNQLRNESLEQTENNLDSTFNDLNEELEEGDQDIRDESDQAEQRMEEGVQNTGQDIEQGAENAEENVREAGEDIERNAEDSLQHNDGQPQSDMNQNESASGAPAGITAEDVQVVEEKEGPNNEVVYEIDGDVFYVDREKKELVKVKKSDLKDSKHEVEIKEGTASGDDSKMKDKKSKG